MGVDPSSFSLVSATVIAQSGNCSLVFRVYLVDFFLRDDYQSALIDIHELICSLNFNHERAVTISVYVKLSI